MDYTIFITNKTNEPMEASIFDITGQNVMSSELKPGSNQLNIHTDHAGTYTIHLADRNHTVIYTQKFTMN